MVGQVLASNHILSLSGQRRMQYGYTIEGWSHHDILALDQPNRTHDGNLTFGINLSASPDVHVVNRHGGGDTQIFAIFLVVVIFAARRNSPLLPYAALEVCERGRSIRNRAICRPWLDSPRATLLRF